MLLKPLAQQGVFSFAMDNEMNRELFEAVQQFDVKRVQSLLDKGADINAKNYR